MRARSRARRGLSQEELGFHANLHLNYVGTIERGEINPTLRVILKLCKGLQMWPSELAELTELRWEELRTGADSKASAEPRTPRTRERTAVRTTEAIPGRLNGPRWQSGGLARDGTTIFLIDRATASTYDSLERARGDVARTLLHILADKAPDAVRHALLRSRTASN